MELVPFAAGSAGGNALALLPAKDPELAAKEQEQRIQEASCWLHKQHRAAQAEIL